MARRLTPRQKRFVEEYLIDLNASKAGIRAGYRSECIGRQQLTKSNVSQAIAKAQEERSKRTQITADWVLMNLKQVVERCMQHVPVVDKEGNEIGTYTFQAHGANRALETLGKHLKMWTDKVEHGASQELVEIYARIAGKTRGLPAQRLNLPEPDAQ